VGIQRTRFLPERGRADPERLEDRAGGFLIVIGIQHQTGHTVFLPGIATILRPVRVRCGRASSFYYIG